MAQHWNANKVPFEQKVDMLNRAKAVCKHWWVDALDCSVSFCRQRVMVPFEDIMARFKPDSLFNIVHRNLSPENHLEISFRTMDSEIDYFLWIILDPIYIPDFTSGLPVS